MDGTVLVVDDDPTIADGHAARLGECYDVLTAYGGREALNVLEDRSVDVVLLDRRMPDLDGEEVLDRLRERSHDQPRVAMVTGVEPTVSIADMPFDDYLVKPVTKDGLLDTVDGLLHRATYDEQLQQYFSLASKIAILESEVDEQSLAEDPEYDRLQQRFDELKRRLDERLDDLGTEGYSVALERSEIAD